MATPKRLGQKYDSFNNKIIDYQIRKTFWTRDNLTKKGIDKFQGEYNALSQLKSDIKNKIESHLDGALLYSRIIQYASLTRSPYNDEPYSDLKSNEKIKNHTLLKQQKEVREKIEYETQKFISEIFTEDRINKILTAIFFGQYNDPIEKNHEKYRIIIAELMMAYAVQLLQRYAEPFIFGQLKTAMDIATFIKKNKAG